MVRLPNGGRDEVVRSVSVVLHMANGQDVVFNEGDEALLVEQPPPPAIPAKLKRRKSAD